MKVNNIQEKSLNHIDIAAAQFFTNTVQKRGNTNANFQIMKNCDWLIKANRNIDQNQSPATPWWRETCILNFILFTQKQKGK